MSTDNHASDNGGPKFSLEDLSEHTVNYGVDSYPPIEPNKETTRAHNIFSQLRDKWPHLFESLTVGNQFVIQSNFEGESKAKFPSVTLVVNPRGPVFAFPVKGVQYGGAVDLRGTSLDDVFIEGLEIVLRNIYGRKVMKVGVTHHLLFKSGTFDCGPWLAPNFMQFDEANLVGSNCGLIYKHDSTNILIQMASVAIQTGRVAVVQGMPTSQIVGPENKEFGLMVNLQVGSDDFGRPMEQHEIQAVLGAANSVWPDKLIELINTRKLK